MTRRSLIRTSISTALLLVAATVTEAVAIVVAPTAVYLNDENPATAVSLYNPTEVPEEVSVDVVFGYPTTDADGNVRMAMDTVGNDPRSAAGWIRVLPRRLVVPPGERRAIRLLAQPPAGLEDGEYWTRLVFTSRGQQVPVSGADASAGVQVGLSLEVRTITALSYRRGEVRTGLEVRDFEPRIHGDSLILHPDFVRRHEAAYIGRLDLELLDGDGETARSWMQQLAVYRDYHRRFAYDVSGVPAGEYQLRMRVSTEREDVPAQARLATVPIEVIAPVWRP